MTPEKMKQAFGSCLDVLKQEYPDLQAAELPEHMKASKPTTIQVTGFPPQDGIRHLMFMCLAGCGFVDAGRIDKANRWLGFLQGVLWVTGFASIDEMKHWNMPDPVADEKEESAELTPQEEKELDENEGHFELDIEKMRLDPCAQVTSPTTIEWTRATTNMTFGEALSCLKAGKRVARTGWNGKGMYLFLDECIPRCDDENVRERGRLIRPCIVMVDAQGALVPGWLASQTDMLAGDWEVVA